jgi:hypothetical protein
LKRDVYWKLPNDYKTSSGALTKGVPIAEYDAASKLAWNFTQLAAKLGGGPGSGHAGNGAAHGASGSRLRRLLGRGKRS